MPSPTVRIQADPFDLASEVEKLKSVSSDVGAVVSFTGVCRSEDGALTTLELEHYPGMAEKEIEQISSDAIERFGLHGLTAIHRYGKIPVGDDIVLVIAASSHRQASFDGANFVMDFLKTRAPFWKKEHLSNGENGVWVDAKDIDDKAMDKWQVG